MRLQVTMAFATGEASGRGYAASGLVISKTTIAFGGAIMSTGACYFSRINALKLAIDSGGYFSK